MTSRLGHSNRSIRRGIVTFVTATLLEDVTMALAPAVYAFIMLAAAGLLAVASRAASSGIGPGGRG
ncbi:MAG: hypothetical protein AB7R55_11745 [Gemmatimonadales bacterium]